MRCDLWRHLFYWTTKFIISFKEIHCLLKNRKWRLFKHNAVLPFIFKVLEYILLIMFKIVKIVKCIITKLPICLVKIINGNSFLAKFLRYVFLLYLLFLSCWICRYLRSTCRYLPPQVVFYAFHIPNDIECAGSCVFLWEFFLL